MFHPTYVEVSSISRKFKVFSVQESLIIKVGSHVVSNGNNKGSNFRKVALVAVLRIKELELDHLTSIAALLLSKNIPVYQ